MHNSGPIFPFPSGTQLVMLTASKWIQWNEIAFSNIHCGISTLW